MTPDTCGPGYLVLFDTFAHVSSSWRTSDATSPSGSTRSSRTLPKRGSMLSGALYEHPTWEPPTAASDCSLLPTPTANQPGGTAEQMLARKAKMPGGARTTVTDLRMVLELLPTPVASDAKAARNATANRRDPDSRHHSGTTLLDAITLMELRGRSTPRQSVDGNASSDAPPPTPSPTRAP